MRACLRARVGVSGRVVVAVFLRAPGFPLCVRSCVRKWVLVAGLMWVCAWARDWVSSLRAVVRAQVGVGGRVDVGVCGRAPGFPLCVRACVRACVRPGLRSVAAGVCALNGPNKPQNAHRFGTRDELSP